MILYLRENEKNTRSNRPRDYRVLTSIHFICPSRHTNPVVVMAMVKVNSTQPVFKYPHIPSHPPGKQQEPQQQMT